ncbi:GNAT family N-acetyltransferase [Terracoccus luteus]|uniref:Ribosomal protein S18 acetylase RimI-like enzyme n=1 Tax=Terracoccus luteus TaxID=53356 RepID=A0A839PPW3_9MICO|nr:GNAT family N-acetyltransferase [Terracoccus luteus]MBB2985129.1 ribosomal protein S18 acetylase RimI-like enzyme [Terracoccus luteus]MCP2170781.1 ribosomal protein S18 acetylase RimI-like enzyme [Terracoccus luteus]
MDTHAHGPAHDHGDGGGHAHDHPHDHAHDQSHDHPQDHGTDAGGPAPVVADASVRLARATDAPAVGLVQAVVLRETLGSVLPADRLADLEHEGLLEARTLASAWRASLERPPSPDHVLLVACAGEQVVGLAAVGPSPDPDALSEGAAELLVLAVHPEARRAGHGSRLLNAAVDVSRGRGRSAVCAWVPAADEAALAFLTGSGLEPDGATRRRLLDPTDPTDPVAEAGAPGGTDDAAVPEVRLRASIATD